ncbi:hypothetical protein ACHWQZ_G000648 [Mnemiopsis leidyi]
MVELEQLNIHSSRDIIARHGLTLPELFALSLEFYKEEKHQFNLSYDQKNQLAAYWRQSTLGPFHPDKLNPGYFDFVGNDRKKAWEALGEISANGAMAGFCNLLETVCPDLVPWIRHKKRERENKIIEKKKEEEAKKKKDLEEQMEASKLINIVRKAEEITKQKEQENSSDEDEDMPGLEKNDRNVHSTPPIPPTATSAPPTPTPPTSTPSATETVPSVTPATNLHQSEQNGAPIGVVEPTKCPELLLPESTNGDVTGSAGDERDSPVGKTEVVNGDDGHVNGVVESEEAVNPVVNEFESPLEVVTESVQIQSENSSKVMDAGTEPISSQAAVETSMSSVPEPAVDLETAENVNRQAGDVMADSSATLDAKETVEDTQPEALIDSVVNTESADDDVKDEIVREIVSGVVAEAESEVAEEMKAEAASAVQISEDNSQPAEEVLEKPSTDSQETVAESEISQSESTEAPTTQTENTNKVTPETLNTILAQHFACVMYLKQMKESGHVLTPEQDSYLVQMAAYDDQLKSLKSRMAQASSTEVNQQPEPAQQHVETNKTVEQEVAAPVESSAVETAEVEAASLQSDPVKSTDEDSSQISPEETKIASSDSEPDKDTLLVPSRSGTNSQESFSMISSGESLQVISSDEACKEPEGTVVENVEVILADELEQSEDKTEVEGDVEVGVDVVAETSEVLPEPDTEPLSDTITDTVTDTVTNTLTDTVTDTVTDIVTDTVTDTVTDIVTDTLTDTVNDTVTAAVPEMTAPPLPRTLERSSCPPEDDATEVPEPAQEADLAKPNNAAELSALAETLQNQLPDVEATSPVPDTEDESDGEVRMWSKTGVDLFVAEVSRDTDSILNVGRGETVTVRIPTYESGTALYWEFATQNYDIGFGASFEWEEEGVGENGAAELKVRREPILPILRRSSHEKVITGSHAFPRGGTYLLMFDNSFSLLRSKTVYYRVFYTR